MNGAEQRERFTSVQRLETRLERRLEDLELVVEAQTALIVRQKELLEQDLQVFIERVRVHHERLTATDLNLKNHLDAFTHLTFWQRLRWLVRGV